MVNIFYIYRYHINDIFIGLNFRYEHPLENDVIGLNAQSKQLLCLGDTFLMVY